jgi:hypothetical protein
VRADSAVGAGPGLRGAQARPARNGSRFVPNSINHCNSMSSAALKLG